MLERLWPKYADREKTVEQLRSEVHLALSKKFTTQELQEMDTTIRETEDQDLKVWKSSPGEFHMITEWVNLVTLTIILIEMREAVTCELEEVPLYLGKHILSKLIAAKRLFVGR